MMTGTRHNAAERLLLSLLALIATAGLAPARAQPIGANVIFVTGDVLVLAQDGTRRVISRGDALSVGDTVMTGEGRVQLGFTDGGVVDLAPNGAFRIDDYAFDGAEDGTERKMMTLLKGGLRTISGAIGHAHHDSYKLDTPVASIGIRGTSYTAALGPGLTVEVGEGAIEVVNGAGALQVQRGQSAFVPDSNAQPVLLPKLNLPQNEPATPAKPSKSDHADNGKSNTNTNTTTANNTSSSQATSVSAAVGPVTVIEVGGHAATPQVSAGLPGDPLIQAPSVAAAGAGVAHMTDSSADDLIGWSRWTGADGKGQVYVLAGVPTVQLPTQGLATYSLVGGSGPSYANGQSGAGTASGGLAVAFGSRTAVAMDLLLKLPDGSSYHVATTGGLSQPGRSEITMAAGNVFGADNLAVTTSPGATGCAATCTGSVEGFFAGSAAERAAIAYGIVSAPANSSSAATAVVGGTAVFAKGTGTKTGTAVNAKVTPGG